MGTRLKDGVPALRGKLLSQRTVDVLNSPHYRALRARTVELLETLSPQPDVTAMISSLKYDDEALRYVQRHAAAAAPALVEALKSRNPASRQISLPWSTPSNARASSCSASSSATMSASLVSRSAKSS